MSGLPFARANSSSPPHRPLGGMAPHVLVASAVDANHVFNFSPGEQASASPNVFDNLPPGFAGTFNSSPSTRNFEDYSQQEMALEEQVCNGSPFDLSFSLIGLSLTITKMRLPSGRGGVSTTSHRTSHPVALPVCKSMDVVLSISVPKPLTPFARTITGTVFATSRLSQDRRLHYPHLIQTSTQD